MIDLSEIKKRAKGNGSRKVTGAFNKEGYLLGVDKDPDPEKWCRSVVTLTELQRKKLIEFLSFGDA